MLKRRLVFGTLMATGFVALCLFDGWLDGSISDAAPDKNIQATIFCLLIAMLAIPAQLEMASLVAATNARIFKPVTIIASILLATSWYWPQFCQNPVAFHRLYLLAVITLSLLALFIYQAVRFTTENVIANCGAGFLAIFYLGFLSSFVLAVRIDFGLWELIMFVSVVKSSDIGAYTAGKIFGTHKFAPKISPGKTWEGLAGAAIAAAIVAVIFAVFSGIMPVLWAILFGILFAFLGQLADLAESMIKRDAGKKDSAATVPGFGGVLDIIDSPLATAPAAYLFFMMTCR